MLPFFLLLPQGRKVVSCPPPPPSQPPTLQQVSSESIPRAERLLPPSAHRGHPPSTEKMEMSLKSPESQGFHKRIYYRSLIVLRVPPNESCFLFVFVTPGCPRSAWFSGDTQGMLEEMKEMIMYF